MLLSLLSTSNAGDALMVKSSLGTNYCALGDSITLSIDVNAVDNSCNPPELQKIPAFLKSFTLLQEMPDIKHAEKNTIYSWTIKPTTHGILEVPEIPIIFTNFQTDKKFLIYSSPIPLQVKNNQNKNTNQLQPDIIAPIDINPDAYTHKPRNILFRQPIITSNQQYLWSKANAEAATAITAEDFINAAASYIQLIKAGARTGVIYYNLGTTLLHANRPNDAWQAFARSERYIGNTPAIRHNMTICINMLPNDNFTSWTRTFLKWHFKRGINTRLQLAIACLIVSILFLGIILINKGNKSEHQARLLLFSSILFISFSTSVAISIIEETADRISEKQQTPEQFIKPPLPLPVAVNLFNKIDSPITADDTAILKLTPDTNKSITATIASSSESPYINQNVTLTLTIQSKSPLENEIEIINLPPRSILQREPFNELPIKYKQINGTMQETYTYTCQARAQQAGKLTLLPILHIMQVEKNGNEIISVTTKPLQLTVQQLPAIDSAEKFSGAIGQFSIQSKISPLNATSTDLIKITTTITGEGYLPEEYLPRVPHAPGFIIYDPEIISTGKNRYIYEQFLAPRNSTYIPAIPFMHFDPSSGNYVTCTNIPFT